MVSSDRSDLGITGCRVGIMIGVLGRVHATFVSLYIIVTEIASFYSTVMRIASYKRLQMLWPLPLKCRGHHRGTSRSCAIDGPVKQWATTYVSSGGVRQCCWTREQWRLGKRKRGGWSFKKWRGADGAATCGAVPSVICCMTTRNRRHLKVCCDAVSSMSIQLQ